MAGFYTPGPGRSRTSDWTIEGGHFAERRQGFIPIARGESIVIIGATLSEVKVTAAAVTSFVVAFAGAVALWWLYFDQSAEAAAEKVARSDDPGRLGRSAYHLIHPVMVAGIIVCAAADEKVLSDPGQAASAALGLLALAAHAIPALALALGTCVAGVVVAIADRLPLARQPASPSDWSPVTAGLAHSLSGRKRPLQHHQDHPCRTGRL